MDVYPDVSSGVGHYCGQIRQLLGIIYAHLRAAFLPEEYAQIRHGSGTVSGFVLTFASCAGFVGPMAAGKIMQHGQGMKEWNTIFYITAGIYVFGAVPFLLFGSAEVQPWGCTQEDDEDFFQIRTQSMVSRATTGRRSRTSTMPSDRSDFSRSLIINEIIADKNEPQILKVAEVYKH